MSADDERTFEVDVEILHATSKAILVLNLKDEEVWVPRSQVLEGLEDDDRDHAVYATIEIPEWLAIRKELV